MSLKKNSSWRGIISLGGGGGGRQQLGAGGLGVPSAFSAMEDLR